MISAASNSTNQHAELPQTPRSLAKSHDDVDVKYFFQRPEQDLATIRQQSSAKWSGDDSLLLEQVQLKLKLKQVSTVNLCNICIYMYCLK